MRPDVDLEPVWSGYQTGIQKALTDRPTSPPGTKFVYSDINFVLLGEIVQRVSGQSLPDFTRDQIFAPLGMHGSLAFVADGPAVPHRAIGYSEAGDHWRRTDQSSTSAVLGDGGIYSSIDDLARWDAALYDDRLLGPAARALAFFEEVLARP